MIGMFKEMIPDERNPGRIPLLSRSRSGISTSHCLGNYKNFFSSVFTLVHPHPKEFGVCRGVLLRARTEFGVQGDKAQFLTLDTFLSVFICVHLCPNSFFSISSITLRSLRSLR
jgi:hypothetical protein